MKRILKWAAIIVGVLVVCGFLAFLYNIPPFFLVAPEVFGAPAGTQWRFVPKPFFIEGTRRLEMTTRRSVVKGRSPSSVGRLAPRSERTAGSGDGIPRGLNRPGRNPQPSVGNSLRNTSGDPGTAAGEPETLSRPPVRSALIRTAVEASAA